MPEYLHYWTSLDVGLKTLSPDMDCNVEIDGLLVIYGSVDGRTAQFSKYRSWSSCHTARLRHDCPASHRTCGLHACVRELQHVFLRTCQSLGDTPYARMIDSVRRCLAGSG